ncbi:MAG TPA: hypothetical protein VKQ29_02445 [Aliidongia sp.]|nr:hypothetical protein [Aliidongia sp.]
MIPPAPSDFGGSILAARPGQDKLIGGIAAPCDRSGSANQWAIWRFHIVFGWQLHPYNPLCIAMRTDQDSIKRCFVKMLVVGDALWYRFFVYLGLMGKI